MLYFVVFFKQCIFFHDIFVLIRAWSIIGYCVVSVDGRLSILSLLLLGTSFTNGIDFLLKIGLVFAKTKGIRINSQHVEMLFASYDLVDPSKTFANKKYSN